MKVRISEKGMAPATIREARNLLRKAQVTRKTRIIPTTRETLRLVMEFMMKSAVSRTTSYFTSEGKLSSLRRDSLSRTARETSMVLASLFFITIITTAAWSSFHPFMVSSL